jgi:hypothetical protein
MTIRSWLRNLFAARTPRTIRKAPARFRPRLQSLEDRLLLSSGPLASLLPAYPTNQSPFGTALADLPTAEVQALYSFILGREPEADGQSYWTARLQSGDNLVNVVDGFLKSSEFTTNLVEGYYETLLGRPAEQAGLNYWTAVWANSGDTNTLLAGFTSSPEYATLHPTDKDFIQSLYGYL